MRLRSPVRTWLVLVASACIYHLVAVAAIRNLWLPQNEWWGPPPAHSLAELAWLQLVHGACLMAGTMPVALALQPLRRRLAFAFELALLGLIVPALWAGLPLWLPCSPAQRVSMLLAWLQFAGMLPLLTWLVAQVGTIPGGSLQREPAQATPTPSASPSTPAP